MLLSSEPHNRNRPLKERAEINNFDEALQEHLYDLPQEVKPDVLFGGS